jgi:hypothetical protein
MPESHGLRADSREALEHLRGLEARHTTNVGFLTKMGAADDHPGLVYHREMLGKVQTELSKFGGGLKPREGQAPAIENAMIRQAWKNEGAGADADDSG